MPCPPRPCYYGLKPMDEKLSFAEFCRRGGARKSAAKLKASLDNLAKAKQALNQKRAARNAKKGDAAPAE